LTTVSTLILVAGHVRNWLFTDDRFFVNVTKYGTLRLENKGKYPIKIKEISIWADDGAEIAPKIENLVSGDINKIIGRGKRFFQISFNTKEFNQVKKANYDKVYLCFDIESESGIVYDQLSYVLLDKNGKIRTGKSKLNRELYTR
jgi:hypothetical protein